jgi:hypothetical protein
LLATFPIAPVNQAVLEAGLLLGFKDFEDAIQHASAAVTGLNAIITRNIDDFAQAQLPVSSPADFIKAQQEIFEKLAVDSNGGG